MRTPKSTKTVVRQATPDNTPTLGGMAILVTDGDGTEMYAETALRCQCCGNMVYGPQLRDWKPGESTRLVNLHRVDLGDGTVAICPAGTPCKIVKIIPGTNDYVAEAVGARWSGTATLEDFGKPYTVTLTLMQNETWTRQRIERIAQEGGKSNAR